MMQRFEDWCGTERKRSPEAHAAWNAARLAAAEHLRAAAGFLGRGHDKETPEAFAADWLRAHADIIAGTRSARRAAALSRRLDNFHERQEKAEAIRWSAGLERAAEIVEINVSRIAEEIRKEKAAPWP